MYTKISGDIGKEYDVNLNISLFKSVSCNYSRFSFINYSQPVVFIRKSKFTLHSLANQSQALTMFVHLIKHFLQLSLRTIKDP